MSCHFRTNSSPSRISILSEVSRTHFHTLSSDTQNGAQWRSDQKMVHRRCYWDFWWDFNGINWGFSGYSLPGIGENCWCLMQKNITGPLRPPKKKTEESQPPVAKKTGFPQLSSSILESLGRKSNHFQNRRYAVVNGFFSVDRIIENDHGKLSLFFSQLWGCITLRRWFKDRVLPEKLGISSLIKLYGGFHKRGEP